MIFTALTDMNDSLQNRQNLAFQNYFVCKIYYYKTIFTKLKQYVSETVLALKQVSLENVSNDQIKHALQKENSMSNFINIKTSTSFDLRLCQMTRLNMHFS